MTPKYSLIIRWSDEDACYIVWVPEFGTGTKTHGSTYEKAAKAGREVIESLIELHEDRTKRMPEPWLYSDIESDVALGQTLFPSNAAYRPPTSVRARANRAAP